MSSVYMLSTVSDNTVLQGNTRYGRGRAELDLSDGRGDGLRRSTAPFAVRLRDDGVYDV